MMVIKSTNLMFVIFGLATFILTLTLWHSGGTVVHTIQNALPQGSNRPSFLEIATKYGTDKVTTHNYHFMYEKYLQPIRDQKLKVLEIGLGCDMDYGPGASYHTWLEFFPNVDMFYIEYNGECVDKWKSTATGATIFTGDQADTAFLRKFMDESGGNFDIIIDDGGHTMDQQMTSLKHLWRILVPGGIYFCEDLATSYIDVFGGGEGKVTMMGMIKDLLDDMNYKTNGGPIAKYEIGKEMRSIDCGEEICAFFKKESEV